MGRIEVESGKLKVKSLHRYISMIIYLLLATHYLLLTGCEKKENIESITEIRESSPEQIIKNFTAFESKAGKKVWSMIAEQAEIFESKNSAGKSISIKNFTIKFYSEDGKFVDGVLNASKGEIDTAKNEFKTFGKTTLNSASGEKLECTDLYYDPKTQKIYSDSQVKLIRKDAIITGKGIVANPDLSSVIIKENMVKIVR